MGTCIRRIDSELSADCSQLNLLNGISVIEEFILGNADDIFSLLINEQEQTVTQLILSKNTKCYPVQKIKNSITVTEAARVNDIAPTMSEFSVALKVMTNNFFMRNRKALIVGEFFAAFRTANGQIYAIGLSSPLVCSDVVTDSSTDGLTVVTLKTLDNSFGDNLYTLTAANFAALKTFQPL